MNNPLTLEGLSVLDAIERRGSFAKAAEELNKATSALSYTVQKLEEQLGFTLFVRQGRRSVLTPAGRLLLTDGRKLLQASYALADRAKAAATGWEPRLRIALESTLDQPQFFQALSQLLAQCPELELDISECLLNGGWEALEYDRVDLVVGAPGPVPQQKGYRALSLGPSDLALVVAASHPLAELRDQPEALQAALPAVRRVISHDTSRVNIERSEGLSSGKQVLYVQSHDQKLQAQLAGLGAGHLPRQRIQPYLDSGELVELTSKQDGPDCFLAWKIANKGKALQLLVKQLAALSW